MSGLAGGDVRVRVPAGLDPAAEVHSNFRGRAAELLAREPFLAFVLALDALVLAIKLPELFVGSDTWLALVGGRQVWSDGIPRHDTMTIWSHGATWVDQQWLGQLLFYGIHAFGGLRLLLVVHTALLVGAFILAATGLLDENTWRGEGNGALSFFAPLFSGRPSFPPTSKCGRHPQISDRSRRGSWGNAAAILCRRANVWSIGDHPASRPRLG